MTVFNFCAGPAMLPAEVMKKAQQEFINWNNTGCSVMELSHRSKEYIAVYDNAVANLRKLLNLTDDYSVLFMHGGGRGQFSAVPLNLLGKDQTAYYGVTGSWSKAAVAEGQKFGKIDDQDYVDLIDGVKQVKALSEWKVSADSAFLHYCPNETVDGIEIFESPKFDIPVVADMSSTILSRQINVHDYDLIYAGV
jgi:phosphoserine aminotransferase